MVSAALKEETSDRRSTRYAEPRRDVRGGDQHDLGRDVGGARDDGKESQGRAS
jgi:hypothetical protein